MAESEPSAVPGVPGREPEAPTFTTPAPEPLPANRYAAAIATMAPGYFGLVMATGIVSISTHLLGLEALSTVLLWMAVAELIVLVVAYVGRAIAFPRRVIGDLTTPGAAVGYFTVVAGFNVVATALVPRGLWAVSFALGIVAFVAWLVLTYGIFCLVVLAGHRPKLRHINGMWLIWVVGTQSVAVLGSELAPALPWPWISDVFGTTALIFWGIGVVLYLILVVIIFLRLFLLPTTPGELGPAYWILMGATAISVRAAAGLLGRTDGLPETVLEEIRGFVSGLSIVLWSFGSWFIPMLVLFGLWRHLVRRHPWSYEPGLWSVVFPLGMYTVSSITLGRAVDFVFLENVARVSVWFGLTTFVVVGFLGIAAFVRLARLSAPRPE